MERHSLQQRGQMSSAHLGPVQLWTDMLHYRKRVTHWNSNCEQKQQSLDCWSGSRPARDTLWMDDAIWGASSDEESWKHVLEDWMKTGLAKEPSPRRILKDNKTGVLESINLHMYILQSYWTNTPECIGSDSERVEWREIYCGSSQLETLRIVDTLRWKKSHLPVLYYHQRKLHFLVEWTGDLASLCDESMIQLRFSTASLMECSVGDLNRLEFREVYSCKPTDSSASQCELCSVKETVFTNFDDLKRREIASLER